MFDICHGCRRCVSLCNAFPTLFDLVDESSSMEVDEDLDRSTETKASAVHFMRFEMSDAMADALKNSAEWLIGLQHPVYTYELTVEGATWESLLNDLN